MKAFAEHYREQGSTLGYQEIYNEPINPVPFLPAKEKGRTVGDTDENFRSCISGRQINLKSMVGDQAGASSIHADGRSAMQSMAGAAAVSFWEPMTVKVATMLSLRKGA